MQHWLAHNFCQNVLLHNNTQCWSLSCVRMKMTTFWAASALTRSHWDFELHLGFHQLWQCTLLIRHNKKDLSNAIHQWTAFAHHMTDHQNKSKLWKGRWSVHAREHWQGLATDNQQKLCSSKICWSSPHVEFLGDDWRRTKKTCFMPRLVSCQTTKSCWFMTNDWNCFWGQWFGNKHRTICFLLVLTALLVRHQLSKNWIWQIWWSLHVLGCLFHHGLTPQCGGGGSVQTWFVFTIIADFFVGVDKKLLVGSGMFENSSSLLSTQGLAFGRESFDCADSVALSDDPTGCPPRMLTGDGFVSSNHHQIELQSVWRLNLISCQVWQAFGLHWSFCCIPALNFCCAFPVHTFPVLLHLIVWTVVEFLHMLLQPLPSFLQGLQLQGGGSKSWKVRPTVSFLDRSHWNISLRLANLVQDMHTPVSTIGSQIGLWQFWWLNGLVHARCSNVQCRSMLFFFCCVHCWNVSQLAQQLWQSMLGWSCILKGLEVLWLNFVQRQVFVWFRCCRQFGHSFVPEGMALNHAVVWMLSLFRCFSCWFGSRCVCRSALVVQKKAVSRHGKKIRFWMDISGSFCHVGVSLLDFSSHMLQLTCIWFPPASLFVEF